ncbi:MAG: hypothetical protein A2X11_02555 [Bacteroidetes bacterium GWE2_42_24]|nr:MAG: hypothetical protein A2X11_02555 [Bacteroidetes bacterium GWE2_42_24]OFY32305.1 MAG: hypothetical protein A2X09_11760 [Bacteroidetes bacterium GWF2_43_11]
MPPDKNPLVSIVTVNFNQAEATCELVDSLGHILYSNIEIIVVDNNSEEESCQIIKKRFPNILLINSPINYGFAAGNNLGIMRARGKYILLLNNDTVVTSGFLAPLIELMEKTDSIGVVSPKILFYHHPDTIQYAGFTNISKITSRNRKIGFGEIDKGQYNYSQETSYAHGAAMLVRAEVVKKVGMMSYAFFLYYEEADWCERIRKAGYQIWFTGKSLVYHKESISTGKDSKLKLFYMSRNRILYLRRNRSGLTLFLSLIYILTVAAPNQLIRLALAGKLKLVKVYLDALAWHIKMINKEEIFENPYL